MVMALFNDKMPRGSPFLITFFHAPKKDGAGAYWMCPRPARGAG
jgi:hypothetical protein